MSSALFPYLPSQAGYGLAFLVLSRGCTAELHAETHLVPALTGPKIVKADLHHCEIEFHSTAVVPETAPRYMRKAS